MARFKLELKWAFIFLIMTLIWMLLEKFSGLHDTHIDKHYYLTNVYAIPAIAVYVFALRDIRKNYYAEKMNYVQGLISGLIITAIVAILSPPNQWIISEVITPEYFPNVIEYSLKTGYHKTREEAEAYFSLQNYMMQSAIGAAMMGTMTSAIVAIFVRAKK